MSVWPFILAARRGVTPVPIRTFGLAFASLGVVQQRKCDRFG